MFDIERHKQLQNEINCIFSKIEHPIYIFYYEWLSILLASMLLVNIEDIENWKSIIIPIVPNHVSLAEPC